MARSWLNRARLLPGLARNTRRLPPGLALAARPLIAAALACVPGWRRRARLAMRAALGPEGAAEAALPDYFRRLADLLVFSVVVYRSGVDTPAIRREWVHDPASRERFFEALSGGKGLILLGPHLVGMEIMIATAALEVPVA